MSMTTTAAPPSSGPSRSRTSGSGHPESTAAWQLIHDDVFDRVLDDVELDRWVFERSEVSEQPHADLIRLMLGMSMSEDEAHGFFGRVLEHRREMADALGRVVHVRVAALDLLTSTKDKDTRSQRQSHPIMVAPEFFERALAEAGSDGVTGLPRASHFTNLLQHELLQRRRRIALAYIDLDGFKHVNDEYGHARGDEVLATMAEAARSVLRRGDVLARIGGDEFGLMLVDVSPEEATVAVERLRARFEELTAPLETSFSAGIALAAPGVTATELISDADRAMYEQKRTRRR
jgi:diguanylate cyclase (GGDEF)-like protein